LDKTNPKNQKSDEIDIEGFKIKLGSMIEHNIIPKYFRSPLIALWEKVWFKKSKHWKITNCSVLLIL